MWIRISSYNFMYIYIYYLKSSEFHIFSPVRCEKTPDLGPRAPGDPDRGGRGVRFSKLTSSTSSTQPQQPEVDCDPVPVAVAPWEARDMAGFRGFTTGRHGRQTQQLFAGEIHHDWGIYN